MAVAQQLSDWKLVEFYIEPIRKYFHMEGVTEICVNRFDEVLVEQHGVMKRVKEAFKSEAEVQTLIIQIANALGQVADPDTHPILDARLNDGSRVCAVLYPTAVHGSCLTFRIFPQSKLTMEDLLESESLTREIGAYLRAAVLARSNILLSGGTGSGKTTLLNILSGFIPPGDRVVTVEDTHELQVPVENLITLEAPHRREGKTERQKVNLAFLIRTALRKRPDRILVGEIRDMEAATAFLHAINTGHAGVCSTIHANDCFDALVRMQTLIAGGGGLPWEIVKVQARGNLHVLIHVERTPRHGRRVVQIVEMREGEPIMLWSFDHVQGRHLVDSDQLKKSLVLEKLRKYEG